MGYDLQITRKPSQLDKSPDITVEEWLEVVENDPELTHDAMLHPNYPYHADWSGPGKYPCWLDYSPATLYSPSQLYSKNPTDEMIEKMVQIAKLLGAKVLGEEDEEYLGDRWVSALEMDTTTGELKGRRMYRRAERR
jgi:hypothetical protein